VFGCFAGRFNEVINEANRVARPLDTKQEISGAALYMQFNATFEANKKQIEEMCQCCSDRVELRLYFGQISDRNDDDPKEPGNLSFGRWR